MFWYVVGGVLLVALLYLAGLDRRRRARGRVMGSVTDFHGRPRTDADTYAEVGHPGGTHATGFSGGGAAGGG
jgi:hypothetical protein